MPTRPMTDLMLFLLRVFGIRHRDLIEQVRCVDCPILVLHGRRDRIAPLRHAEQIVDAAADAALHVVDDAEHLDIPHVAPPQHEAIVREFLNRVGGDTSVEVRAIGTRSTVKG